MPIEIKELVVKLTVHEGSNLPVNQAVNKDPMQERRIIDACVKRVLKVLESRRER